MEGRKSVDRSSSSLTGPQARLLEQQAQQERAAAYREARKKRDEKELVLSRQQAVAAASGGGASDPTIVDLMSGVEAEGEIRAEEAQYLGDVRASDLRNQAAFRRAEGKAARTASYVKAAGTLLGDAVSLYDKYNPSKGADDRYSAGRRRTTAHERDYGGTFG